MLRYFLPDSIDAGNSAVLIIHGKGWRSGATGGALKPFTLSWLKQQSGVKAFCSVLLRDGGARVVYVLLRVGRQA